MNTTDRSIALVDAALRRRFYFFGFFPDEPPIEDLLSRWLEENSPQMNWVADLVETANRKLKDRHMAIGPSHFMKNHPPLDERRVQFHLGAGGHALHRGAVLWRRGRAKRVRLQSVKKGN